jgi:hypothetical protein
MRKILPLLVVLLAINSIVLAIEVSRLRVEVIASSARLDTNQLPAGQSPGEAIVKRLDQIEERLNRLENPQPKIVPLGKN